MMFYRIIEQTETSVENKQQGNDIGKSNQEIKFKRASPKKLYKHLTKLIIRTTKSINENSSSAITKDNVPFCCVPSWIPGK